MCLCRCVCVSVCAFFAAFPPAAVLALWCGCVWVGGGVIPPCSDSTSDSRDENGRLPYGPNPGRLQENSVAGAT